MPIKSEAADAARREALLWASLAAEWTADDHRALWEDLPPTEQSVVRYHDPQSDLHRRGAGWGYEFTSYDLADLCRFGAALAIAEAAAWEQDDAPIASHAYEDRRFLLGDRILHWAVPWLDAAARCHPPERDPAERSLDILLDLGDRLRPAPALSAGTEGLFVPGEDSFGPRRSPGGLDDYLLSVWSGRVVMQATIDSIAGRSLAARAIPPTWLESPEMRVVLSTMFRVAAPRWQRAASDHPGSARLWLDLAARANSTADAISAFSA